MSLGITEIQDVLADFCTVDLLRDFTFPDRARPETNDCWIWM